MVETARPTHSIRWTPAALGVVTVVAALLFLGGCEQEGSSLPPREKAEMEALFAQARMMDEQGRFHEALVRYETILARHPTFVSTRLNAAMAAYDSGQYQKASDHFEVLHRAGPGDWFVVRKLIQCNERLNNTEGVEKYRAKLERLRNQTDGSVALKRYEGLTRDYIPVGSMHLIGYEFFEPKKHGRLWLFKLEDKAQTTVSTFMLEATPFHGADGKRMFCLTEANRGWLRIWHIGAQGRDYAWTRDVVLECLHGKRQPLVTKPLPPDYQAIAAPGPAVEEVPERPAHSTATQPATTPKASGRRPSAEPPTESKSASRKPVE